MIRAVSKKNGICVVMPLWAVAIWKWQRVVGMEGSVLCLDSTWAGFPEGTQ